MRAKLTIEIYVRASAKFVADLERLAAEDYELTMLPDDEVIAEILRSAVIGRLATLDEKRAAEVPK